MNSILKKKPELLDDSFEVLYRIAPDLVDFDIKRRCFATRISKL
jgi:hypothetical protein